MSPFAGEKMTACSRFLRYQSAKVMKTEDNAKKKKFFFHC
jgi:hypothetical protein